jgi:antitoxin component of RelBE/YafQ-DinJ toxin-antitoxin module
MTEQIQIGVKVEKSLKDDVDVILRGLDIKPTTAINGLYQYILQHRELPFVISTSVKTPKDIAGELFKSIFSLRSTLSVFLDKINLKQGVRRGEVLIVRDIVHDFILSFRQGSQYINSSQFEHHVIWGDAVQAAEGAYDILLRNTTFTEDDMMQLDDKHIRLLSDLLLLLYGAVR